MIKADEGCEKRLPDGSLAAYLDTRGIWTIGYGYNICAQTHVTPALAAATKWTMAQAEAAFEACFNRCIASLDHNFPGWPGLTPARQAVAVSAMYQLGVAKVLQFAPTIRLITDHQYDQAAKHMLDSAWGRETPERVARLADMMRSGAWPASATPANETPANQIKE